MIDERLHADKCARILLMETKKSTILHRSLNINLLSYNKYLLLLDIETRIKKIISLCWIIIMTVEKYLTKS